MSEREREDAFDHDPVEPTWSAATRRDEVAPLGTPPESAEDYFTQLWKGADRSHGHHLEALAELRERKRREQERPRRRSQRQRDARYTAPVAEEAEQRVECERCARAFPQASFERVTIPVPLGEPVEHLLCPHCADEVRRGLLRLLAGEEPLPAAEQDVEEAPLTIRARAGWFAFRLAVYVLIALVVFALVTWLSVR